jgi:flagellar basal-body rod protein FlgC
MVSALGTSASALRDATVRLEVAAHNIANANTPGFQPSRVDSVELTGGGVAPVVTTPPPEPDSAELVRRSGTDLAEESIRLVIALIILTSNARAIETAETADKTILDTLA